MKYFQPLTIEKFIDSLLAEDREIAASIDTWNIEREEVSKIMIHHFRTIGIFEVKPHGFAVLVRDNLIFQLKHNPTLKNRMIEIQRQIEKVKSKHTRHHQS